MARRALTSKSPARRRRDTLATKNWACKDRGFWRGIPGTGAFERLRGGPMKNDSLWRGTLVVAFAIGAGWIGYMGWPLNGLITRAAEQSTQAPAVFQDPN